MMIKRILYMSRFYLKTSQNAKKTRICKKTIPLYNTADFSIFPIELTFSLMNTLLIIIAVLLIIVITMQSKGTGLSIIPGSNDFGKFERRGPEKILHQITIGLVSIFTLLSVISYFLA